MKMGGGTFPPFPHGAQGRVGMGKSHWGGAQGRDEKLGEGFRKGIIFFIPQQKHFKGVVIFFSLGSKNGGFFRFPGKGGGGCLGPIVKRFAREVQGAGIAFWSAPPNGRFPPRGGPGSTGGGAPAHVGGQSHWGGGNGGLFFSGHTGSSVLL